MKNRESNKETSSCKTGNQARKINSSEECIQYMICYSYLHFDAASMILYHSLRVFLQTELMSLHPACLLDARNTSSPLFHFHSSLLRQNFAGALSSLHKRIDNRLTVH